MLGESVGIDVLMTVFLFKGLYFWWEIKLKDVCNKYGKRVWEGVIAKHAVHWHWQHSATTQTFANQSWLGKRKEKQTNKQKLYNNHNQT